MKVPEKTHARGLSASEYSSTTLSQHDRIAVLVLNRSYVTITTAQKLKPEFQAWLDTRTQMERTSI